LGGDRALPAIDKSHCRQRHHRGQRDNEDQSQLRADPGVPQPRPEQACAGFCAGVRGRGATCQRPASVMASEGWARLLTAAPCAMVSKHAGDFTTHAAATEVRPMGTAIMCPVAKLNLPKQKVLM